MQNVNMLYVIMQSVIMLSIVAPNRYYGKLMPFLLSVTFTGLVKQTNLNRLN